MSIMGRCGNCASIDTQPGLNTVQCLICGCITRTDGVVTEADGRFTDTIHVKHQASNDANDVPVEG